MSQYSKELEQVMALSSDIEEKWRQPFIDFVTTYLANLTQDFAVKVDTRKVDIVVPFSIFPQGYHCDGQELPAMSIALTKSHIALHHLGFYYDNGGSLLEWFEEEYPKHMKTKLNMGKACIRFTNPKTLPLELIGQLAKKMTPQDFVDQYLAVYGKQSK